MSPDTPAGHVWGPLLAHISGAVQGSRAESPEQRAYNTLHYVFTPSALAWLLHASLPGLQSKLVSMSQNLRQEQAQKDCIFFLQGRCSKGSLCPFRHDAVRGVGSMLA